MPPARSRAPASVNGSPSLNTVNPATSTHPAVANDDSRSEIPNGPPAPPGKPRRVNSHSNAADRDSTRGGVGIERIPSSHGHNGSNSNQHHHHHHHGNASGSGPSASTSAAHPITTTGTTPAQATALLTAAAAGALSSTTNTNGPHAHEGIEGIDWTTVPISVLHKYRHAYRLRVPSASSFYNNLILSQGIGLKAPSRVGYSFTATSAPIGSSSAAGSGGGGGGGGSSGVPGLMRGESGLSDVSTFDSIGLGLGAATGAGVGKRGRGRCTREQLATAVRKNFNAQPISESDVIVNFLYSVKNQGGYYFQQDC